MSSPGHNASRGMRFDVVPDHDVLQFPRVIRTGISRYLETVVGSRFLRQCNTPVRRSPTRGASSSWNTSRTATRAVLCGIGSIEHLSLETRNEEWTEWILL